MPSKLVKIEDLYAEVRSGAVVSPTAESPPAVAYYADAVRIASAASTATLNDSFQLNKFLSSFAILLSCNIPSED